jgi:hypothetical protein
VKERKKVTGQHACCSHLSKKRIKQIAEAAKRRRQKETLEAKREIKRGQILTESINKQTNKKVD